ncbi:TPA: recombinase family protein [Streptococcus pyogenes]|nr:recombinase family protein [Streptococcus pyogenes]
MITSAGRFIAYLRVSTARQGISGLGLDAQRETVRAFLNGGDWSLLAEFIEVESGRRSDRPQLAAALARCRAMRATLIVANVSRLTRSVSFLSRLLEAGVDVRFCDLPQIEGPTGRFLLTQMVAVAELEAGLIGERTRKALTAAKARGVRLGGLRANSREVHRAGVLASVAVRVEAADRRAADLAPLLAEVRAAGASSLREIAKGLNDHGARTPAGREWGPVQVSRLLTRLGERELSSPPRRPPAPTPPVQPVATPAAPIAVQLVATAPAAPRTTPPRRNRVTPFGTFEAVEAHGTLMGNRGCLHDRDGVMGEKTFRHRNWIICALHFRGRQRTINAPGLYTELFFADEATAMAAGHRPCAECQRSRYDAFKSAWRSAHGITPDTRLAASEIDAELHAARVDRKGHQLTHTARIADLPDGVMVTLDGAPERPLALWRGGLHPWSHSGYGERLEALPDALVRVLTPAPLVRTMAAGYAPTIALDVPEQASFWSELEPAKKLTISVS